MYAEWRLKVAEKEKAVVYFTKEITPQAMIRLYEAMGVKLPGKVAVKLHSGEVGNQNFLRPDFMKPMIDYVKGTIVECNTAYEGKRNTTEEHWNTMKLHGWTEIAEVDILDEKGEMELPIPGGKRIQKNFVGANMKNYDSMLVLSHFKGHPMGGFGGALKNIIALGAGISDGMGYGDNAKAALMTRGLAEISRLGIELGADRNTFMGLSGVGDLIVTCTSMHSRNRRCGIMIGEGVSPKEATERVGMVVEGMYTTEAAYELAKACGVEMPITEQIYRVIRGELPASEAVGLLMGREKKHED